MIIIADSGSTKTDWCVVNHGKQVKRITTEGTNPFFQTEEEISQVVKDKLMPHLDGVKIDKPFISMGQVVPFQKRMRLSTMPFIGTYR